MTVAITDRRARERTCEGGFTLIEAIVALALMGLVLSALASITAQWLPNWNRGVGRIQREEAIDMALQRVAADLAAAEYVPANRDSRHPLFDGSELSVTFVRTAMGPNIGSGLDVVHLGETSERGEFVMVRSRMRFAPLPVGSTLTEQLHFGDPVVLLRAPYRLSFAYAGPDRIWKNTWRNAGRLPAMVKLTIRDAASQRVLQLSTIAPIHAQLPSDCMRPDGNCEDKDDKPNAPDASGGSVGAGQGGRP